MKFSASQLKKWQECSLQAKYRYLDDLPEETGSAAVYGSALHEACDQINKGCELDEAIDVFRNYMHSNPIDYYNRTATFTGYMDSGPKIVEMFFDHRRWSPRKVLASEFRFMVPMGEHEISGIVDCLEVDDAHSFLAVSDYKSGRRPIYDQLYLDIQMTLYHWATMQEEFWLGHPSDPEKYTGFENGEEMFHHYQNLERKTFWHDLKKGEEVYAGPRTMRDFARLYRVIEQVTRAVEKEVFVPTINANTCTFCSYTDICPVYFENDQYIS